MLNFFSGGCRRFEERNTELETQYIDLREDKADVVAFLKRTLQQRTDTIHELTDRLEGMKVAHQDEKQDYERQLAELRAEYTKTKDDLDGEIMVSCHSQCNTVIVHSAILCIT